MYLGIDRWDFIDPCPYFCCVMSLRSSADGPVSRPADWTDREIISNSAKHNSYDGEQAPPEEGAVRMVSVENPDYPVTDSGAAGNTNNFGADRIGSEASAGEDGSATGESVDAGAFVCRWRNCNASFDGLVGLVKHLETEHVGWDVPWTR